MAYLSGFEHDVFVSYAHADNQVAIGGATGYGWVTTLRHNLIHATGALRKDVYIDHQLKPGAPFDADLRRKVERSALLLIVLSQSYIESDWCGKELEHFVNTHGDDRRRPRDVMVVELRPFEGFEGVPENIEDLRKELIHAQFWYQTADALFPRLAGDPSPKEAGGSVYWRERDKLLHAVDSRLKEIRGLREMRTSQEPRAPEGPRPAPCAPAPVVVEGSAGVLLADVTDDLVSQRNQVKIALEKEGIRVLPEGDYVGRSAAEFAAAFARDARSSLLFVQLLSPTPGRIPKGEERPLPQLQFAAAREAGLTILQWCAAVPESDVIADPAHRALFATPFLCAVNLERFKDEVIKKYRELGKQNEVPSQSAAEAQNTGKKWVFFDDLVGEEDLSRQIREIIKKANCQIRSLPKNLAHAQDEIDNIKELLRPCRAGITMYADRRDRNTVRSRLIRFINQVAEGNLPLSRWGVYFGPPPDKLDVVTEFGIDSEDVIYIPGMHGLNEAALVEFLQSL